MAKKILTIGVPAYHALGTIYDLLASVQIQSIRDEVEVIISNDDPMDNGSYEQVKERFPNLSIEILDCEKNTGPGLARQRALDACNTPWIMFIDADDILYNAYSLEVLKNNITPSCIQVMGAFMQEIDAGNIDILQKQQIIQGGGKIPPRLQPNNNPQSPWVFGKLFHVPFLRKNDIGFSANRAMEDGEFCRKILLTIEGTKLQINRIEDPIYIWRTGSEHSITRIGAEQNGGIPIYNYSLCQVGATVAFINAIKFCKRKNPFNGNITRFTVETMIGQYFTYITCIERNPVFKDQNLFNAKRFYHSCYKEIENQITDEILTAMYTHQMAYKAQELVGIIPRVSFFEFMDMVKNSEYRGKEEFDKIRAVLPSWIIELEKKSGVLGNEGYIYTDGEKGESQ